jgi:hypothetical protein
MGKNSANDTWLVTPYVVNGSGGGAYTTIQAAINAIVAAGVKASIYLYPGVYSENLDFSSVHNILFMYGTAGDGQFTATSGVSIQGTHSLGASTGALSFQNIAWQGSTAIFSSAAAGASNLTFDDCGFNLTSTGTSINIANWTGSVVVRNCYFVHNRDAALNLPASNSVSLFGVRTSDAVDTTVIGSSAADVAINSCSLDGSVTIAGSGIVNIRSTTFLGTLTISSTAAYIDSCDFLGGSTAPCLAITGGTQTLTNCYLWTTGANPVITYSGGGSAKGYGITCRDSASGTESFTLQGATVFGGNVSFPTGSTIQLNEIDGTTANGATCGIVTLSSGVANVTNSLITTNHRILATILGTNSSSQVGAIRADSGSGTIGFISYLNTGAVATGDGSSIFWIAILG